MTETHRAVRDLGARGIQLFSNINGRPLDEPEYLALFAAMAEYDLPVWLHPFRGADMADYRTETRSKFEIWWTLAGMRTGVAMARLVFAGIFDRHRGSRSSPTTSVPWRHGPSRVGPGWDQLGSRTSDGSSRRSCAGCRSGRSLLPHVLRRYGALRLMRQDGVRPPASSAPDTCSLPRRPIRSQKGPMYPRDDHVLDRLPVSEADRERLGETQWSCSSCSNSRLRTAFHHRIRPGRGTHPCDGYLGGINPSTTVRLARLP